MSTKRANAWALLCALGSAIGCATLPSVPEGACGNLVVEGNEDCEQFSSEEGTRCGPATAGKRACRFVCGSSAENARCPTGYGCGTDGICRASSGAFAGGLGPTLSMSASALGAGDFDGDGRSEIVAQGTRATTVFGLELGSADARASLQERASFLSSNASFPALGELAAGGRADLALVRSLGFVSLWRGEEDGELAPTFYAAFPVTGDDFRLLTAEVLPGSIDPYFYGHEVLVASRVGDAYLLAYLQPPGTTIRPLLPLPAAPTALAGTQRAGRFAEALPCDVQVIAYANAPTVALLPLCRSRAGGFEPNDFWTKDDPPALDKRHVEPSTVSLGAYSVGVGGVIAVDVDADGHLDLVIDGAKVGESENTTLVAYGLGDGRFDAASWKGKAMPAQPSNSVSVAPTLDCGSSKKRRFPLALGQLTRGDDRIDAVFASGVCYRTATEERFFDIAEDGGNIKEAAIGDINGNGIDDVVAASRTSLEIFSGTGDFAHRFTVPTTERGGLIALGDVDGDLVKDIAYRDSPEGVESVMLMFGRALAGPEAPLTLGSIEGEVQQILVDAVNSNARSSDALADIGVVSKDPKASSDPYSVALLHGTTDRQLEAPFSVGDNDASARPRHSVATMVTAGHFLPGPLDALAIVAGRSAEQVDEVWLAITDENAGINPKKLRVSRGAVQGSYDWAHARSLAVDLDARSPLNGAVAEAPIEELVIAAPAARSLAQSARLFIGRVASESEAFVMTALEIPGPPLAENRPFELVSGDFDGDGAADVAVRTGKEGDARVNVFFNDGAGSLVKVPVQVPGTNPLAITTCMLVRNKKVLLVAFGDNTVRPVSFDGRVASLGVSLFETPGVKAMVCGDVNGDGVDDLAAAQSGFVSIRYGAPLKP